MTRKKQTTENKDFDIMYSEYVQKFVDLINNSGMPLTTTIDILTNLLNQTQMALQNKINQHMQKQQDTKQQQETETSNNEI